MSYYLGLELAQIYSSKKKKINKESILAVLLFQLESSKVMEFLYSNKDIYVFFFADSKIWIFFLSINNFSISLVND